LNFLCAYGESPGDLATLCSTFIS